MRDTARSSAAITWVAVVAVLAAGLLGTAVVPTPAGAAAVVEVTPSTGLVDGQEVDLEITGAAPNRTLVLLQCVDEVVYEKCDLTEYRTVATDASGAASATMRVYALFDSVSGVRDCRVEVCLVGAGSGVDDVVMVPVEFDASAPLRPPHTLSVTPSTGLTDGQVVTASLAGGRPNSSYGIEQCAAAIEGPGGCLPWSDAGVGTDTAGSGASPVDVWAAFRALDGTEVDCRTAPGACELRSTRAGVVAASPLTFVPDTPLPPASTAALTPADGFVDRQVVSLDGNGWRGGDYVQLSQCAVELEASGGCRQVGWAEVASDGTFTTPVALDAWLFVAGQGIDCRTAAGRCELRIFSQSAPNARYVYLPLSFDPSAPFLPPPTASATPDTGLVDGQVITVEGSGFVGDGSIGFPVDGAPAGRAITGQTSLLICDASRAGYQGCGYGTSASALLEDGSFTTDFVVASIFTAVAGDVVDCRDPGVSCELRIGQVGNAQRSTAVPLSFDPDGPLRPPPTMTVTPSTGLRDRDVVTVRLDSWNPRNGLWFNLCGPEPSAPAEPNCVGLTTLTRDPDGFTGEITPVTVTVALRARFTTPSGTVDCRTTTCRVVAGYPGEEVPPETPPVDRPVSVAVPVSFDPSAPLLEPEIVGIDETAPPVDGQIVTLRAKNLTPRTAFEVRQCPDAGEWTVFLCDETTLSAGWVSDDGTIAPWVVARRYLGAEGTTDCVVERCVLRLTAVADRTALMWPFPMSDGTAPPVDPIDPVDPPAQPSPSSTSTTRPPTTTAPPATPSGTAPRFTG